MKRAYLPVLYILFFPLFSFSGSVCSYSDSDLVREQRSLAFTTQEWQEISTLIMNMDFQKADKDISYIKQLTPYQNILLISFLHRWSKNSINDKGEYIRNLSGCEQKYDPMYLKQLFRCKLEQYLKNKTVSSVFLSDLGDILAIHKNIYSQKELDELIEFFPKIESNILKNSFFYILLSNNFFSRKKLPFQYSSNLNPMLLEMTNTLRKRLNLSLLQ